MTSPPYNTTAKRTVLGGSTLLAVCLVAAVADSQQFFQSYLFAWLYWLGMALGGFGLLMLHHLVGGRWGFPVRRFYEAGVQTVPLFALCFIPLLFGISNLYAWARPAAVHASEILQKKHAYMNAPFFVIRIAAYFVIWIWITRVLKRWSRTQDCSSNPEPTRRLRAFSAPGVCLFFLAATFANIDLLLSLEADWYSTVFAAIVIIGNTLATLAFSIVLLALWRNREPFSSILTADTWSQLGNLLFAFVMLWAYLAFSQLLVIYSGNLPHEIVWYLHRSLGGWKAFGLVLAVLHFALPFALLLSKDAKRNPVALARIAGIILIAHVLDIFWLVAPTFPPHRVVLHWQDVCLFVALGAIWLGSFLHFLECAPLLPLNDPRFAAPAQA